MAVLPFFDLLHEVWIHIHQDVLPNMGVWGYVLIGVLVATEGPVSALVGAAAARSGALDVRLVLLATVIGNVVGDCLWYAVGTLGKLDLLDRYGRWAGIRKRHTVRLRMKIRTQAAKMIILSKIAHGMLVPTLVVTGMARVPWRRWFPIVFVVEMIWSAALVWVGYRSAGMIGQVVHNLRSSGLVALGLILLAVSIWQLWRWRRATSDVDGVGGSRHGIPHAVPVQTNPGFTIQHTGWNHESVPFTLPFIPMIPAPVLYSQSEQEHGVRVRQNG